MYCAATLDTLQLSLKFLKADHRCLIFLFLLQTTKAFLPDMIESDKGHVVTIASMAGIVGVTKLVDYCASKFAAVGFNESLSLELESYGHHHIHTTAVCPYFIRSTGMFEGVHTR